MKNIKLIILTFFLLLSGGSAVHAQDKHLIDSINVVLSSKIHDTIRVYALISKQRLYEDVSLTESQQYAQEALNLAEKIGYKKGQMSSHRAMAVVYNHKGEIYKSIEQEKAGLEIAKSLNKEKYLTAFYNGLGNSYGALGKFDVALKYYQQALNIHEKLGNKKMAANMIKNIGNIFADQKNEKTALQYYLKAYHMLLSINADGELPGCEINIGIAYKNLQKPDSALVYYNLAYRRFERHKNLKAVMNTLDNIGKLYIQQNQNILAKQHLEKALDIAKKLEYKEYVASMDVALGNLYRTEKDYKKCKQYLDEAMLICPTVNNLVVFGSLYDALAHYFAEIKDFNLAYKYLSLSKIYQDSVFNSENAKNVQELEARFKNEKQEQEIVLLEQDQRLKATEIKRQTQQKYTFIVGFVFMLFLTFYVFKSYKTKKKANELLTEKNAEISQQKEEIQTQTEELLQTNNYLEEINLKVSDSINYAETIQRALLVSREIIKQNFPESFLIFYPRDVVSGDFYWFHKTGAKTFIAVGDCTGHGVPGAFMSIIGISLLNEIVIGNKINNPSEILQKMDEGVRAAFSQNIDLNNQHDDGLELSVCCIDTEQNQIVISSTYQPVFVMREGKMSIVRDEVLSIGSNIPRNINRSFNNETFGLDIPTKIYMLSDGYYDQFGGSNNYKITRGKFESLILQSSNLLMIEQQKVFDDFFVNWRGTAQQTDDVLMIGFQI